MTIDQVGLYIIAPFFLVLLAMLAVVMRLSQRQHVRFTIRGLGVVIGVESCDHQNEEECIYKQMSRKDLE